jgi:hypothetical protein
MPCARSIGLRPSAFGLRPSAFGLRPSAIGRHTCVINHYRPTLHRPPPSPSPPPLQSSTHAHGCIALCDFCPPAVSTHSLAPAVSPLRKRPHSPHFQLTTSSSLPHAPSPHLSPHSARNTMDATSKNTLSWLCAAALPPWTPSTASSAPASSSSDVDAAPSSGCARPACERGRWVPASKTRWAILIYHARVSSKQTHYQTRGLEAHTHACAPHGRVRLPHPQRLDAEEH